MIERQHPEILIALRMLLKFRYPMLGQQAWPVKKQVKYETYLKPNWVDVTLAFTATQITLTFVNIRHTNTDAKTATRTDTRTRHKHRYKKDLKMNTPKHIQHKHTPTSQRFSKKLWEIEKKSCHVKSKHFGERGKNEPSIWICQLLGKHREIFL